jgi:mercuric transport protein
MKTFMLSLMILAVAGVAIAASPRHVVLDVQNMTCPTCTLTIEAALDRVPGVTARRVDADTATVTVTIDTDRTSVAAVARAITEAGFPAEARAGDE